MSVSDAVSISGVCSIGLAANLGPPPSKHYYYYYYQSISKQKQNKKKRERERERNYIHSSMRKNQIGVGTNK